MNTATQSNLEIETYLVALRTHLAPITLADREDILREIAAHIRDSVESGSTPAAVLARLGPTEALAAQYRDGALIRAASHSVSPVTLLRATLRVATKGIVGFVVFFFALIITGIIKPFLPANTGLWFHDGHFVNSGVLFPSPQAPAHEILGLWYIPIALFIGGSLVVLTTLAVRLFLRLSQRWQTALGAPPSAPATIPTPAS
jgi:uncharacterized membrane protein